MPPTRTVVVQGPPMMPHGGSGASGPALCGTNLTLCDMAQLIQYGYIPGDNVNAPSSSVAFDTFVQTTGFVPYNFNQLSTTLNNNNSALINSVTYFVFYPIIILTVVIIWLAIIWGGICWEIGLFLTLLVVVVLLTANILFRQQAGGQTLTNNNMLAQDLSRTQTAQQESIAYWPQGMAAVSNLWRPLTPAMGTSGTSGTNMGTSNNMGPGNNMGTYGPIGTNLQEGASGASGGYNPSTLPPSWNKTPPSVSVCRSCPTSLNKISTGQRPRRSR